MKSSITLLKEAWALYTANASLLSKIYIIPYLLMFAAVFLLAITGGASTFISSREVGTLVFVFALFLFFIPVIFAQVLATIALIQAIAFPNETTVGSAYTTAKRFFWRYVLISILLTLIIATGLILLIIPGIIFALWFAFVYYVAILEDKGVVESLKASKAYVKGNMLLVFKKTAVITLLYAGISFVVLTPIGLILGSESFVLDIVDTAFTFVMVPVSLTYFYLLYSELKNIKEAKLQSEQI